MLNRDVFSKGMLGLCEVYDREPTDALLAVYYEVLKGMSDDEFNRAVGRVLSTNKYATLPKPAEILGVQDEDANALEAVLKVEKAMSDHGAYQTVIFDDPVLAAVVARHGWPELCALTLDEWKWRKKEIEREYKALSVRPPKEIVPCIGIAEHENRLRGFEHKEEPVLIGSPDRKLLTGLRKPEGSDG